MHILNTHHNKTQRKQMFKQMRINSKVTWNTPSASVNFVHWTLYHRIVLVFIHIVTK